MTCTICGERIRWWQDYTRHIEKDIIYHDACLWAFICETVTREIESTGKLLGELVGSAAPGARP